jgi:hypothetical protein
VREESVYDLILTGGSIEAVRQPLSNSSFGCPTGKFGKLVDGGCQRISYFEFHSD